MTAKSNPPPAPEISLKYMAWDVKKMAEALKQIADTLAEIKKIMENQAGF